MKPAVPFTSVEQWISSQAGGYLVPGEMLPLSDSPGAGGRLTVRSGRLLQEIEGFGHSLTGGSAMLINAMESRARSALLEELFGTGPGQSGISYLRLSLGASDLSAEVFSYNDMPPGESDPELENFSIDMEREDLIPVIREILAINPDIRFMASPWSPPAWMKNNRNSKGGSLLPEYYGSYAQYFVKYVQAMAAEGIRIDAVTIQNEPHHDGNQPSMYMTWQDQAEFIRDHLGPAFAEAGIDTKIIIWDHNADNPEYPINILNDEAARQYVTGSAFHLYNGGIGALSRVYNAHPDKRIYFTEQWYGPDSDYGSFMWHVENVFIGAMKNWSSVSLEWNLAADPNFDPHTVGGCDSCMGAVTIDGNEVTRNPGFYPTAHFGPFVPAGSRRLSANASGRDLNAIAFLTPEGAVVVVAQSNAGEQRILSIEVEGQYAQVRLPARSVGTFVFR
jgi:glucosylceramidase